MNSLDESPTPVLADEALAALAAKAGRAAKKVNPKPETPAERPECPFEISAVMEDSFASSVLSVDGLELGRHSVRWIMRTKANRGMDVDDEFEGTGHSFTVKAIFQGGVCRVDGTDWPVEIVDHPEFRGDPHVGPAVLYVADGNR